MVCSFTMAGGKSKGMPGPVKAVLSKFGGGKEEDKMVCNRLTPRALALCTEPGSV